MISSSKLFEHGITYPLWESKCGEHIVGMDGKTYACMEKLAPEQGRKTMPFKLKDYDNILKFLAVLLLISCIISCFENIIFWSLGCREKIKNEKINEKTAKLLPGFKPKVRFMTVRMITSK